jgi:hypothetical protein
MTKQIISGAVLAAVLASLSRVSGCGGDGSMTTTLHLSFVDPRGIDVSGQVTYVGPVDGATLTSGGMSDITIASDQTIQDVTYTNATQYGPLDGGHKKFSFTAGVDGTGQQNSNDTYVTVNLNQTGLHGFLIYFTAKDGTDVTSKVNWAGPHNYDQLTPAKQYDITITSGEAILDATFQGAHQVGIRDIKKFSFVADRTDPKITVTVRPRSKPLEPAAKSLP